MSQKTRDQLLVQQSLSGDTSAYGILVDRYSSLVAGIARHYGAGCDAEDLVQDVFLQAWRNLPGLRNHNRFGPWIARIARNQGLMVPTTVPSPSRRRRVLGALAAAVLPLARSDAAVPAPPSLLVRSSPGTVGCSRALPFRRSFTSPSSNSTHR